MDVINLSKIKPHELPQFLERAVLNKTLNKAWIQTEAFELLWRQLVEQFGEHAESWKKATLSAIGRAAKTNPAFRKATQPDYSTLVSKILTQDPWLETADQRQYLAEFILSAFDKPSDQWLAFAAQAVVREETGEKARRVWTEVSLKHATTLADFVESLNHALDHHIDNSFDADQVLSRIRRIADAITPDLATLNKPGGENLGSLLKRFFTKYWAEPKSISLKQRISTAQDLLHHIHKILRLNADLRDDPEGYAAAAYFRTWFSDSRWFDPKLRSTRILWEKALQIAVESLLRSARRGFHDEALRSSLRESFGGAVFDRIIENALHDLSWSASGSVHWLRNGQEASSTDTRPTNTEALRTARAQEEKRLGALIIQIKFLLDEREAFERKCSEVEAVFPQEAETFRSFAQRVNSLGQLIELISRHRSLSIIGGGGDKDEESYNPDLHEPVNPLPLGTTIKYIRPGVIKLSEDGTRSVVVKALVEKR